MEKINFERQVNEDLFYCIFDKKRYFDDVVYTDFENETFILRPYDWNEPDDPKPNFEHKPSGFKLWWYKYPLRSPKVNCNITHYQFSCILYDCINSLPGLCKWEIEKWWNNDNN